MTPIILAASDGGSNAGSFVLLAMVEERNRPAPPHFRHARNGPTRHETTAAKAAAEPDLSGSPSALVGVAPRAALWTYLTETRNR
ncbi:hypothetical protein amrb99_76420 [Actinomadura sp. RB99]|nr:hypothetical protein [Actinomadura sp. RB99]